MNRFEYLEAKLAEGEIYVARERGVRLYDGDNKTHFEAGEVVLTSRRILWGKPGDIPRGLTCLSLHLKLVYCIEEESGGAFGFGKSKKIVLHVNDPHPEKNPGPVVHSVHSYVKLSFKEGFNSTFLHSLNASIEAKEWLSCEASPSTSKEDKLPRIKTRTGIVGIERSIQEKQKATDESINQAFQDLSKLMTMAKDMVNITKSISNKIRERQGDITEDETIKFKSYLLSLGIDDPVTRDSYRNDSQYHRSLANQLSDMLVEPVTEVGGMMSLSDVFVRVNRARGLELLSPEDLLAACRLLPPPLQLRKFPSGAMVLQLESHNDEAVIAKTAEALESAGSLSAEQLAHDIGVSVVLAKERLLTTEMAGKACRDYSMEGLRFYPNLFLTMEE